MMLHKDGEAMVAGESARSARREVRNPIYGLAAMEKIRALSPDARDALAAVLAELRVQSAEKAEASWVARKGPMAAYWRAVSLYCRHIRGAVLKPLARQAQRLQVRSHGDRSS